MVKLPSLLEMLKAGVHFGHQTSKWHPKMKQYIFGSKNGVHVIDLERTQEELDKTLKYVKSLSASGKVVLFVGTKHQARDIVKQAAESCGMPYLVERWIGGLLTNFSEVKKRLRKYRELKDMFATGEIEKYSKKERVMLKKKLENMDKYLVGLVDMQEMPDILYIADMRIEKTAALEAEKMEIPVVAVTDTNVNPKRVSYLIPANDDAVNSIRMMANLVAESLNEGKLEWEKKQSEITVIRNDKSGKSERKALKINEE